MKKNIILIIVSLALLMESVDTTVINTSIPAMAHSLQVNPIDLKLALISYLLSLAIFIPISGWMADKFGAKKVFINAIAVFTLSSIWCGFTHSLLDLVIARIIQGLGGSLMLPIGRLIIVRTSERHELIAKMSIVVMIASIGMMLGPVVGGSITSHVSWRWIFWVNVPVGILAILLSIKLLPEMPARRVFPLDKLGFILFGSGLAALTLGLSIFSESDIQNSYAVLIVVMALLLLFFYTKHSRNKPHPIVRVDLLRARLFRISITANLLARIGFGGIPFLIPLLLQICLGFSPQLSGILIAPMALGVLFAKPLILFLLRLIGYKNLLIFNTFLVSLSLCSFTTVDQASSIYSIGFLMFIYGFLIAIQYTGMNSLAYANLAQEDISSVTSMMSTNQQLSQSFGVAVAAILVRFFSKEFSPHQALTIQTFHQTFIALAILTLLTVMIYFYLKKDDGKELIDIPS